MRVQLQQRPSGSTTAAEGPSSSKISHDDDDDDEQEQGQEAQVQDETQGEVSGGRGDSSIAAIPDGPLNLTVSGYASAADGTPGPPVSGMSYGVMIVFDATPPRVLRASPAVTLAALLPVGSEVVADADASVDADADVYARVGRDVDTAPPSPPAGLGGRGGGGDHGNTAAKDEDDDASKNASDDGAAAAGAAKVRAGDIVTVMLQASKPVRYPNVTINSRPAWVTRTSWDGTSYQVRVRWWLVTMLGSFFAMLLLFSNS